MSAITRAMHRRIAPFGIFLTSCRALSTPPSRTWAPTSRPILESQPVHVIVDDEFGVQGGPESAVFKARALFDETHGRANERAATEQNFKWEYWNAGGGQYAHLRTPGEAFFDGELYAELVDAITTFGQRQLGMNACTPPWLSCYVDGHEQRLHTDSPHGPWAFVLSLSTGCPPLTTAASGDGAGGAGEPAGAGAGVGARFTGGETMILNPSVLDYWRGYDGYGKEEGDLFTLVAPVFGRMVAFDPRLPHGVRCVHGPRAMADGRLVLHGWFSEPTPFFAGGLAEALGDDAAAPATEGQGAGQEEPGQGDGGEEGGGEEGGEAPVSAAAAVLNAALGQAVAALGQVGRVTGCLSVRVSVDGATGEVKGVDALADSLVADPDDWQGAIGETDLGETIYEDARADVLLALSDALSAAKFPPAPNGQDTEITVPFVFE